MRPLVIKNLLSLFFVIIFPLNSFGSTLKVGVSFFDPPFIFHAAKNNFYGFDISMMNYICHQIKQECQYIPFHRDKLIDALKRGVVDVAVSGFDITAERQAKVNFSVPYLINVTHIIGLKRLNIDRLTMQMLNNKKIGIAANANRYEDQIKILGVTNPKIKIFQKDFALIDALNKGTIDFAFVDKFTAHYWSNNSSNLIKDFGCPMVFESKVGIAMNPHIPGLQEKVDHAILLYRKSNEFKENFHRFLLDVYKEPGV